MDTSLFDKHYNEHWLEPIYTSYMDKGMKQKCIIDFGTLEIKNDRNNNTNHNLKMKCIAKTIYKGMDVLNNDTTFYMVAPLNTFTKMLRNSGIDIRVMIKNKTKILVEFIVINIKSYKILYHEILK